MKQNDYNADFGPHFLSDDQKVKLNEYVKLKRAEHHERSLRSRFRVRCNDNKKIRTVKFVFSVMVHFRGLCLRQKVQSTTNAHFVHVFVSDVMTTKKYEP